MSDSAQESKKRHFSKIRPHVLVAEQFLELVDKHAETFALNSVDRGGDRGERRRAGAEIED